MGEGLPVNCDMNHVVVLGKLPHAISHLLAIAVTAETHQRVEPSLRLAIWLLLWLQRQVVAEEVVFFDCEWVYSVMLHELIETSEDGRLIFDSCEACHTFLVSDRVRNLLTQIL